jgi:hypothetical protein
MANQSMESDDSADIFGCCNSRGGELLPEKASRPVR